MKSWTKREVMDEAQLRKSPFYRLYRHVWIFKLTPAGRYFFCGLVITGLMSSAQTVVPLFHLTCALIALFMVTVFVGWLFQPRMHIEGRFPEKTSAGQPTKGDFTIANISRFPGFDLSAGFFHLPLSLKQVLSENLLSTLQPKQSSSVSVTIEPLKRGLYTLPALRVFSTFPFNLCRSFTRGRLDRNSLLVLPSFTPLTSIDIPASSRYQPGGIALTSNIGESPEYIGSRDYRSGDNLRHIDFRSWGRLARPVVREFQEEYYCRIALLLDTYVPPNREEPRDGFADLEAGISLTSSVADALNRGEYIIDIFAAGSELYVFRSGRHTAHFEHVLEILACVDACRKNPFGPIIPALATEWEHISCVVFIFLDWDKERMEMVRAAAEAGCGIKIYFVCESETTLPVHTAEQWADSVMHLRPSEIREGGVDIL